ncbi:restriction endonuclease subunit S [Bacteroides fragilis]|uniref:restriction endonuclease subunit S n=1 Tax=Bacteroides fragilis TaxID=817 RepID=UPI0022AAC631|nr:restriction endonuclease subunit S [Bacteroides fragilis]MCZ2709456.1 restriction endonuclease subunit S [Bacteroides fragilis]
MNTKKLRQKILDLAIHGKLVPQDPNDEPASVLLERIKAEKERLIQEGKIKRSKKSKVSSDTPHYEQVPFEVPGSWVWCTLGDLAFYKKGPFGSSLTKAMFVPKSNDTYKVYEQKNAIQKDNTLGSYFITKEKYDSLIGFAIQPYDIIVSCAGTIGETYVLPQNSQEGIINQALMLIRLYSREIEQFYLLYFDFILKEEAYKESKGTAIKNIPPFDVLKGFHIPLPPISEQQRILKEIEHWFSLIDIIERGKDDLQTTIKQAKSKILDLAIHGKLVPQDPNDEPASELLKRINPKAEVTCDNGHSGKLPQGWCNCKISDVSISLLGKTLDRGKNTGNLKKYLCAVNVKWGTFELSTVKEMPIEATELERYSVKFGDLMVCEGGDVGRAAIWTYNSKMYYQNALHRIRFKENISAHYFLYSLMYLKLIGVIDDVCKGVTIKHLTQNAMNTLKFNLPPIAEQQRIVQKIEELFSILDNIQNALEV